MDLVHSPVKFYRDRVSTSCLAMAMAALLLCVGLVAMAAALSTEKVKPLIEASMAEGAPPVGVLLTVSSAVGGGVTFAVMFFIQLFILCCFYWFCTKPAQGTVVRLAEFAGVAAFVRVPALALNLLALSLIDPASVPAGLSGSGIDGELEHYQNLVESDPLIRVANALDVFSGVCASALRAVALFVLTGCSTAWAVAAGVSGSLFYLVPWVMGL